MMKKLLQIILATAMVISCIGFVSCSVDEECQHDYVESVVAATCDAGGYTEHKCSKCGDTYKDNEVAALGHNLTDWAEKTPATCTAGQVEERHCQRCEFEETRDGEVGALGHLMKWTVTKAATCEETGLKNGVCEREGCEHTETDVVIPELGHLMAVAADDPEAKAPTCEEDGLEVTICTREGCGKRETHTLFAQGHTDSGTKADVTAPTCTEKGYTTRICSVCGNEYTTDEKDARGHEWSEEHTEDATCTHIGTKYQTCLRDGCGAKNILETYEKLRHVFDVDGNCTNGCGKNVTDKNTWISAQYDVSYNESTEMWRLDGGDSENGYVVSKIFIPAEVIKAMADDGATSIFFVMKKKYGTTPRYGYSFSTADKFSDIKEEDLVQKNNVDVSFSADITDDMIGNGLEFWTFYFDLYYDTTDGWKAESKYRVTGFDFAVETIKPFDINDKSTWLAREFTKLTYSEEKGMWVIYDGDPGEGEIKKLITIKPEVFKSLPSGVKTLKIGLYCQNIATQRPRLAIYDGDTQLAEAHAHAGPATAEIVITDDMRENGYSFYARYIDNNQKASAWKATEIVTGFDLAIEFKAALNSETASYTYGDKVAYDGTIFVFDVESAKNSTENGGVYFTIGSYGVYFRGNAFRPAAFNGTNAVGVSHSGQGSLALNTFTKGVKIGLSVSIKDENTVTVTVYVNGSKKCEQDIARVSEEIESNTATARVEISTLDISELVLIV